MDMKKTKKLLAYLAAAYWVLVIAVYLISAEQFRYTVVKSDALSAFTTIGEMTDGVTVTQRVVNPADALGSVEIMGSIYDRESDGVLNIRAEAMDGALLAEKTVPVSVFAGEKYVSVPFDEPIIGHRGEAMRIVLTTQGCDATDPLTIYYGNKVTAGRFDIVQNIAAEDLYTMNGTAGLGKLCLRASGMQMLSFYKVYWVIVIGAFAVAATYVFRCLQQAKEGKSNLIVLLCSMYFRYNFLIRQLVNRDFKTKYKRSVLGVAWSFLNPLLSMGVQYIVFSTIFRNDTPNYPVYLLTGIVFFNFFSEAVSLGMSSITGNASLIKKVYMPKYIYPVSRVLSSLVNFVFALIPIFLVVLLTGTPVTPALLLLVFDILCMVLFVLGMVLLLSTCMTFFQDTQFLWTVVSMMWMYLTPIFYPETIIPAQFLTLYHMNPMYQYITFARVCIIDGVSPAPTAYLWCILSSVVMFIVGAIAFKKNQDKFVLYL